MTKLISKIVLTVLITFVAIANSLYAASDAEMNALRQEIAALNGKLSSLESRVTVAEGQTPQPQGVGGPYVVRDDVAGDQSAGLIHTLQDINMGGYLDVQYNANLSKVSSNPNSACVTNGTCLATPGNYLRTFDNNQNTFTLNAAKLWFAKEANPDGGVGFRLDILMGHDAAIVDFNPSYDSDQFAFEQAYIEGIVPFKFWESSDILPHKVKLMAGRYVTMAGFEVIEGPNNWNISRSILFGYALPFTHLGVRSQYGLFNDFFTVTMGVNNGWDNAVDNNVAPTLEGALSFSPFENIVNTTSTYWGPENDRTTAHKRFLISNVTTYNVTDKLSLAMEWDWGNERRVPGLLGSAYRNAQWWGVAGYARYQFTEKFAMAGRFEYFRDPETFRVGLSPFNATVPYSYGKTFWSPTITGEYKFYENFLARLEYRYDNTQNASVLNGKHGQSTIGAQLIYII